jgi:hypothetical protein
MFVENLPTDANTQKTATDIAKRCRFIVQGCLREEEWGDAETEFYRVVREELERFRAREQAGSHAGLVKGRHQ